MEKQITELKSLRDQLIIEVQTMMLQVENIQNKLQELDAYDPYDDAKYYKIAFIEMCNIWNIPTELITGRNRSTEVVMKKHIMRWVGVRKMYVTTKKIGKLTGTDHSTVVHSCQVVDAQIQFPCIAFEKAFEPVREYINNLPNKFPGLIRAERYKLIQVKF